jgi:hypothetical protein
MTLTAESRSMIGMSFLVRIRAALLLRLGAKPRHRRSLVGSGRVSIDDADLQTVSFAPHRTTRG